MENHEIQTVLMNALPLQEVHVSGDGSHFQVIAVGEMFDGMSRASIVGSHIMFTVADIGLGTTWIAHFDPAKVRISS